MTEKYTPEKVAERIAEARKLLFSDSRFGYEDAREGDLIFRLADALAAVSAERDRAKSGAKTLGEIVDRQVEDTLRWAGMEDQIGMDDPDQQLAWELCAEMPGKIATLQADRDRLHKAIAEALGELGDPEGKGPWLSGNIPNAVRRILRAALDQEGNDDE